MSTHSSEFQGISQPNPQAAHSSSRECYGDVLAHGEDGERFTRSPVGSSSLVKLKVSEYTSSHNHLGGAFKYFLFSPLFGEDSHFDEHIFQRGWFNHQLVMVQSKMGVSPIVVICWKQELPLGQLESQAFLYRDGYQKKIFRGSKKNINSIKKKY